MPSRHIPMMCAGIKPARPGLWDFLPVMWWRKQKGGQIRSWRFPPWPKCSWQNRSSDYICSIMDTLFKIIWWLIIGTARLPSSTLITFVCLVRYFILNRGRSQAVDEMLMDAGLIKTRAGRKRFDQHATPKIFQTESRNSDWMVITSELLISAIVYYMIWRYWFSWKNILKNICFCKKHVLTLPTQTLRHSIQLLVKTRTYIVNTMKTWIERTAGNDCAMGASCFKRWSAKKQQPDHK